MRISKDLNFDVFWKDEKVGHIEVKNNRLIKNESYTDNILINAYSRIKTYPDLVGYMQTRIMCYERWTPEMLKHFGLKEYNLFDIFKTMHGMDKDDYEWCRFEGEDLTYNDVKVRD